MKQKYFGADVPKLGFGLMRLPRVAGHPDVIDVEQTAQMVDEFLAAGFTYFDTAYVYTGSEDAARQALVERVPREKYTLASKLAAWQDPKDEEKAKRQFETTLERTQAGYLDFYLLHSIESDNVDLFDRFHIWDYMNELKSAGKIRHWGFSFHDDPKMLDRVLTEHPDAEFVQLQINYADWNSVSVHSRENLEVARQHGKGVVVMEPVRGGLLANPPQKVAEILHRAAPDRSSASWAIRFAASQDNIMTVLSGMSNLQQLRDNISFMKEFQPLSPDEEAAIHKAQDVLDGIPSIPCTGCSYCTEGCPQKIAIPDIFAARNTQLIFGAAEKGEKDYERAVQEGGAASDCIQCGQCESVCPQHLNVTEYLKECARVFGR